ncbi:unnamed protein product [Paramecium primaurelia]|uniref:Uncharacterized protein n=1 Tax=Paramecium primaurelia TaxID=5886 RepID=A0A8S1NLT7_PARPR|nr:unnamed protein product [Paramecium primaurelia]
MIATITPTQTKNDNIAGFWIICQLNGTCKTQII